MLPITFTPEAMDAAAAEKNREIARTNEYLERAYQQAKKDEGGEPRKCDVLDKAQMIVEGDRQADQSKGQRSIEYYFKSRALTSTGQLEVALKTTGWDFGLAEYSAFRFLCAMGDGWQARVVIFVLGAIANLGYDFVKAVAFTLDWVGDGVLGTGTYFRDQLKSGPTPITPPGGSIDGIEGAFDGLFEDGRERGRPERRKMIDRSLLPVDRGMTSSEMASLEPWGGTAVPGDLSGPVVGTNRSAYGAGSVNGRSPGVVS